MFVLFQADRRKISAYKRKFYDLKENFIKSFYITTNIINLSIFFTKIM